MELRDTESKVYQVERYELLLSLEITRAVLTGKDDAFLAIPSGCLDDNMLLQQYRCEMKCLNPNQNENTWVSKTVEELAILDNCISSDKIESKLVLFTVEEDNLSSALTNVALTLSKMLSVITDAFATVMKLIFIFYTYLFIT